MFPGAWCCLCDSCFFFWVATRLFVVAKTLKVGFHFPVEKKESRTSCLYINQYHPYPFMSAARLGCGSVGSIICSSTSPGLFAAGPVQYRAMDFGLRVNTAIS